MSSRLKGRSRRRVARWSIIAGNCLLLLTVAVFIIANRSTSQTIRSSTVSSAVSTASSVSNPLDQLSSAQIALQAAQMTGLPEVTAVRNQADSETALSAVVTSDAKVATKPQIVSTAQKSKHDIITYKTGAGDTISGIAAKFGLAPNSIRWSNNLTGEAVPAGRELLIPPANGIVYKVKAGDTIDSLASHYQANRETLIVVNDAESGNLPVGSTIWIPNGVQGLPTLRFATSRAGGFSFGTEAIYGANGYDRGYCTWWASLRRTQIGRPIPSNLGNACTWKSRAQLAGLGVGTKPQAGAVIWTPSRCWGHVGFVEKKNDDGSIWVSDMNSRGFRSMDVNSGSAGGWNRVSYRLLSPDEAAGYWYIY